MRAHGAVDAPLRRWRDMRLVVLAVRKAIMA